MSYYDNQRLFGTQGVPMREIPASADDDIEAIKRELIKRSLGEAREMARVERYIAEDSWAYSALRLLKVLTLREMPDYQHKLNVAERLMRAALNERGKYYALEHLFEIEPESDGK